MTGKSPLWRALAFGALALCAACQRFVLPPTQDQAMRQVFAEVRDGRLRDVEAALAPDLRNPVTMDTLAKIETVIPKTPPLRVRVVQWNTQRTFAVDHYGAVYQYDYPGEVLIVRTKMAQPMGRGDFIEAFRVNSLTTAQAAAVDRFTLTGKSPLQYAVLIGAILSPLAILAAVIDLFRAKNVKRKWVWLLGIIWGVSGVAVNWSNGVFAILFINIALFGGGISKAGYVGAPWIVDASLPLVALIFLFRDRNPVRRIRRSTLNLNEG